MAATLACPDCGTEVAPGTKFCPECGARQPERPAPTREVRKLVTVLFADVAGSTAIGEQLDPEALRSLMTGYFARMRSVIEGHGGTVEKFIGDAVMAVFGIPQVHEDDALRAVRAAWAIRDALAAMNAELEAERGISVRFRTGVNTGEVVAGDLDTGTTLVTGDTVNTAARLEQAAPPGEILVGKLTWSLVRDAVDGERVEPILAKGKAEPVAAYRLTGLRAGADGRARQLDAPLIGRERELTALADSWRRAVEDRSPHLVTLVAPAGVGKSRLVHEFIAGVRQDGGRVLVGRCLSYGQGITYWPIREIVHEAAGIIESDDQEAARTRLERLGVDLTVAARVAAAIGLSSEPAAQEELFWAIRRLLEHLADEQATLVVLEDLHWAEDTLLDLVEYVLDLVTDVPLLILATARPDLAERRPASLAAREVATTVRLEPLGSEASSALLDALPGGAAVPGAVRDRILAAAEGNPLYVEELLGLLRDEGRIVENDGTWTPSDAIDEIAVPVGIQALLAARLDALPDAERQAALRASVIGRRFEVAALAELAGGRVEGLTGHLLGLVRKELLRPDRPELTAGDAFRYRHVLIRDAAYAALPKRERANLHERFAAWLERVAGDRLAELEAIAGYHLETAHRLLLELGERGQHVEYLAVRAADRLAASGITSRDLGDVTGAIELLERARVLAPGRPAAELALSLAYQSAGASETAVDVLEIAVARCRAAGDGPAARRLTAAMLEAQYWISGAVDVGAFDALVAETGAAGAIDPETELELCRVASTIHWQRGDSDEGAVAMERALGFAKQAGLKGRILELELELWLREAVGSAPLTDVIASGEALLGRPDLGPVAETYVRRSIAVLYAMRLDGARARREMEAARTLARELRLGLELARVALDTAWLERLLQGPSVEADLLAAFDGPPVLAAVAAVRRTAALARAGRLDEAAALLASRRALAEVADVQGAERGMDLLVEGRIAGVAADARTARALVARALETAQQDRGFVSVVGDVLRDAGDVLALIGDVADARGKYDRALEIAEAKGNLSAVRATRERLAALSLHG